MTQNKDELFFVGSDEENDGCTRTIEKKVSVAAKVEIKPIVHVKESEVEIECCGPATVKRLRKKKRRGKKRRHKKKRQMTEKCKFIIQQELCVRIPIHFDTENEVKPLGVICDSREQCHDYQDNQKNN